MIDLDRRTSMMRELAFNNGTLDVINEDTRAFEEIYDAVMSESDRISNMPLKTGLLPKGPERINASELLAHDDADFIENAYVRVLHRDADISGGTEYLLQLRDGHLTKQDILFKLRMSGEGRRAGVIIDGVKVTHPETEALARFSGYRFVENAYNWLLGRRADATGLKHHMEMLENGCSKRELLQAMAGSPERADVMSDAAAAQQCAGDGQNREMDALKRFGAEASIQAAVAQRQSRDALNCLADAQRRITEQNALIERCMALIDQTALREGSSGE